ncbi:MAG: Fur family transcriptional regulator [Pyramidobacter sp.]|jgi:Fe2+ or Zn2+ uptake regulation protein
MTKYGKLIADVVLSSHDHPTAEQVFFRVKEKAPQISLATVYNNLKALVEEGLVRKLSLDRSPDRYDRPHRHDHMVCLRCGKVVDVALNDLTEDLERRVGTKVYAYDLTIHYLCPACAAEKGDENERTIAQ